MNATTLYNETPLVYAIRRDNYDAVKILLENGANPNAEYGWEGNFGLPLEYCLHHGRKNRYKIAELLLSYGASGFEDRHILIRLLAISRLEDDYETASYKNKLFLQWMNQYYKYNEEFNYEIVYWAVDGNGIEEFLYMINNYTINLNQKNDKSQYILIPAARNRNVELFDLLIGYGAEFGFIDKNGKSIEDYILDVKYDKRVIDSEYKIINYDNEKQEMLNILREARENVVDQYEKSLS